MLLKDLLTKELMDRAISKHDIGTITIFGNNNMEKISFFETKNKEELYNYVLDNYKNYRVCSIKPVTIPINGTTQYKTLAVESYIDIVISKE